MTGIDTFVASDNHQLTHTGSQTLGMESNVLLYVSCDLFFVLPFALHWFVCVFATQEL